VFIPGVGIALALVFTCSINITMGSGLILLLVKNGMYHPTWGPAGTIAAFIPGLDFLPFWLGIVITGIVQDMKKEGGVLGTVASVATLASSPSIKNATSTMGKINTMQHDIMPRPANNNQPSYVQQAA